ncbi:diguanylate cyclase [Aquabacterium sp. J223]|uniref:diguanylate cyclase n=1 Tax=Aquabacterium sp. J223 TaxID=2898431 RepID=UPI0021AD7A42|nr:diguanylate cyclase [Aquabacterium sp. J223]UUX94321.1 diguanylate cyclase [Aquabacterium sp. J223]
MDATAERLTLSLLFGLVPLWLLAGWLDWCCHRWQRIEHSAGVPEALLHLVMLAQLGLGLMAVLLLQVTSAVLLLLLACLVAHELTMWADLAWAESRREIPVPEQWVHGLQSVLPWAGGVAVALLHPQAALALLGMGEATADWGWRWREPPLDVRYVVGVAATGALGVVLPFLMELRRALRVQRRLSSHSPAAARPRPKPP